MHEITGAKKIKDFYKNDPSRWTKGVWARDKDGDVTTPRDTEAVCWCIEATYVLASLTDNERQAVSGAFIKLTGQRPMEINDLSDITFEDMMGYLDRIIAGEANA